METNVLIVDDDPTMLMFFKAVLAGAPGVNVITAESGEEALRILGSNDQELDVLITDVFMPGINGLELLKRSQELNPHLVCIVTSAGGDIELAVQAMEMGAFLFLEKPVKKEKMEACLFKCQQRLQLKRELKAQELVLASTMDALRRHRDELEQKNLHIAETRQKLQNAYDEISRLIKKVTISQDFSHRYSRQDISTCFEIQKCEHPECPCYGKGPQRCWLVVGTLCNGEVKGKFAQKYKNCHKCEVYIKATAEPVHLLCEEFNIMMGILEAKNQELLESREQLQAVLETASDAIVSADSSGRITYANNMACKLFGYGADELLDKNVTILMPERFREAHPLSMARYNATRAARVIGTTVELVGLRKDGVEFPLELSLSAWQKGKDNFFTAIIRDSSERKQFEEALLRDKEQLLLISMELSDAMHELKQTQAQLFQTAKLADLGEMATGLAHEMNQPLAGISLISKSLQKLMTKGRLTDEELRSGLGDIELSVNRMARIIDHIRTFARQNTLAFIQVNTNETINAALTMMGEQLRLHCIEVILDYDPDLPFIVGEPFQLEQVWINMIANARDALDEKGAKEPGFKKRLRISTCLVPEKDMVRVTFADNGPGIPEGIREKVLEPFFTTKEVGKGMGLGMSISYGIIKAHRGEIGLAESDLGGAEINVSLPCTHDEA